MTNRLLNPQALEAYIHHTVDSVPMRELARRYGREPSTILRQVRKVEELRDNPEWSIIVDKLAEHWDRKTELDLAEVYKALGTDTVAVMQEMQKSLMLLVQSEALVGITTGCEAGIFVDGEVLRRTDRMTALAWIASGWLILARDGARVRRYKVTDKAVEDVPEVPVAQSTKAPVEPRPAPMHPERARKYTRQSWGNEPIEKLQALSRRKSIQITSAEIETAQSIRYIMHQAELNGKDSKELKMVIAMNEQLGKEMFDLLYDFLHRNQGLEQIEKDYQWPARSAKIVLLVALQQVAHFGLLKEEEPAGVKAA